jgi:UDP-3-O-[3-hydroxymyristoyl] glucosamine N-acyltransferase
MTFTAQQIADYLQGEVVGNKEVAVGDFSKIEEGRPGTLTFLSNPKYTHFIYTTKADVVLVDRTFEPEQPINATLIKVESAYQSLAKLLQLVDSVKPKRNGIHTTAVVPESAKIGENVYIGAYAVIGEGVQLGNNVKIYPHTVVDNGAKIGDDTTLYANVTVYEGCEIGRRCIIHSGVVIGADGFGFAPDEQGHYNKIPQIGDVQIGDDVEVGANATIDRSTMGSTRIHNGVKIDNLCQVAHNVEIGDDTVLCAQVGVAGSTKIGKHCLLAGQVGIAGHLTIADGNQFGAKTGVNSTIDEVGKQWQGYPVVSAMNFRRIAVCERRLPDLLRKVDELEKKIQELQK